MKRGAQTAAAVIAGYLLGRTKKMRLALMIAAAGATGKHGTNPTGLLRAGLSRLGESAELGKLTESVRGELLDSARAAATKAATSRVESLTQRLSGDSGGQKEADGETAGEERDTGGGEAPSEDGENGEDRTGGEASSGDGEERTRKPSVRKRSRPSGGEDEAGPRGRRATSAAGSRRPARKRAESSAASSSAGEAGDGGDDGDRPRTRARSSAGRSPVRRTGR